MTSTSRRNQAHRPTAAQARAALAERLRARRTEIEQATLDRVFSISDSTTADPSYLEGLRASVSTALDYALEAIERGEERAPPPPPSLLAQARLAARSGIGLDTVLRRYFAGYTLLGDFLAREVEREGLPEGTVHSQLLQGRAALFDRLLAAVSEEYEHEAASRVRSSAQRRAERIERLLAGELLDTSGLAYDFEGHHVGLIAAGPQAAEALRELAAALDQKPLIIPRDELTVWAWLGSRRDPDPAHPQLPLPETRPPDVLLAVGEPARGLNGWRLTHRQAAAAYPIARRNPGGFVRYSEVALLASTLRDDLLTASLRQLYLTPLAQGRDNGEVLRETLRAYFAAARRVSATAAVLGTSRQTVTKRLGAAEECLGRSLHECGVELEVALRLDEWMET